MVKEGTDHFVFGHADESIAVKAAEARACEVGTRGAFEGELVLAVCDFNNLEEKVVDGRLDLAVNVNGHNALIGDVHIMERRTFNSVEGARHGGGGSIFVRCRGINNERSVGAEVHVGRDIGGNIANIDLGAGKINGAAQIEAGLFVVLAEGIAGVSRPGSRAKSKHAFLDHEVVGKCLSRLNGEGTAFLDGHRLGGGTIEDFAKLVIAGDLDAGLVTHVIVRTGNKVTGIELIEALDHDAGRQVEQGDFRGFSLGEVKPFTKLSVADSAPEPSMTASALRKLKSL